MVFGSYFHVFLAYLNVLSSTDRGPIGHVRPTPENVFPFLLTGFPPLTQRICCANATSNFHKGLDRERLLQHSFSRQIHVLSRFEMLYH